MKLCDFVGRKHNVAAAVELNALAADKHQLFFVVDSFEHLRHLLGAHLCRSKSHEAEHDGVVGSVPPPRCAETAHQLAENALGAFQKPLSLHLANEKKRGPHGTYRVAGTRTNAHLEEIKNTRSHG